MVRSDGFELLHVSQHVSNIPTTSVTWSLVSIANAESHRKVLNYICETIGTHIGATNQIRRRQAPLRFQ
jgi:hypothetical protein